MSPPGRFRSGWGDSGALWDALRGWKGRASQVISVAQPCHSARLLELPKGEIEGKVEALRCPGIFFSLAAKIVAGVFFPTCLADGNYRLLQLAMLRNIKSMEL